MADDIAKRLEESRLPVRASAEQDQHHFLARQSDERVSRHSRQECSHLAIRLNPLEELVPQRTHRIGLVGHRHEPRDPISAPMGSRFAGAEVERPVQAVEQPGIGVELVGTNMDVRIGLGVVQRALGTLLRAALLRMVLWRYAATVNTGYQELLDNPEPAQ